ncbi:MAG: sugar-binding transcriptional regulator [Anaerolineae bacterium]
MAIAAEQKKLLYKIAKAYYEDGLTQDQIGKRFGLSRIKVSRLLQQARAEKLVQITIVSPEDSRADLERELEARYGLYEAVVISPSTYEKAVVTRELGPAAVECLLRCLQGHEVLSVSWGSTLLATVEALPVKNWPEMTVVQMMGGLGRPEAEVHGNDIARRMAQAFGARPRMLSAPGIVASKMVRDALLADPQISDTLALSARADIAMVGIGVPVPDSVVMQAGAIRPEEAEQLKRRGAVGDIALRFFDADGRPIKHEINDRIIGLDLDQIKYIPRVIGVAGGAEKFEVIRAALRGKFINVLVTDDRIAARLLEDSPPEEFPVAQTTVEGDSNQFHSNPGE